MKENATQDRTEARNAEEFVYIEGFGLVDPESGELIEADQNSPEKAPFLDGEVIPTETDVEWALGKLFRIESEASSLEYRMKAEIEAIEKNLKPRVNAVKKAAKRFEEWVKPSLRRFAELALKERNTKPDGSVKAKPEKSLKYAKGALCFRAVNAVGIAAPDTSREVNDAIEWLRVHYPTALKPKWALDLDSLTEEEREEIRAVVAGEKTSEEAGWSGPCPLKVTLPGEKFDVRTGVK